MRICVIGAGAIGGFVGARFAFAGHEVSLVARGAHLRAIRERGLTLIEADGREHVAKVAHATDDISTLGQQDVVIVALKAHQMEPVLSQIKQLCHPETLVIPMQNGIPFWYFLKHGGPLEGTIVRSVDPQGLLAAEFDIDQLIGCVVYPAALITAPGVIRCVEGERFPLGELDGQVTPRITRLAALFEEAGFKSPILDNIRAEIWLKLWGNLSFNPLSALTHKTLAQICRFEPTRELARKLMEEAQQVAESIGITFRVSIEKRIAGAEKVGEHKTSMLQDVETGREPEIDALVGSVLEIARLQNIPTPHLDTVYVLVKSLSQTITKGGKRIQALAAA
ncbi:MAG: 2-dehydropantoate 2-reductase [Betaproteobacteria bacterium]|nr:2-dehydropantoate 2-reductase [Betaproteobacteria bacterium]